MSPPRAPTQAMIDAAFGAVQPTHGRQWFVPMWIAAYDAAPAAAPAAPAPDADAMAEYRVMHRKLWTSPLEDRLAALVEQQARELAYWKDRNSDLNGNLTQATNDAERAERDLSAARAAIAAADAMREQWIADLYTVNDLRVRQWVATLCDEKWDRSGALLGRVRTAARAAMEGGNG